MFTSKKDFFYSTGGEDNGNLLLNKSNTMLVQNYYTTRGIRLFN